MLSWKSSTVTHSVCCVNWTQVPRLHSLSPIILLQHTSLWNLFCEHFGHLYWSSSAKKVSLQFMICPFNDKQACTHALLEFERVRGGCCSALVRHHNEYKHFYLPSFVRSFFLFPCPADKAGYHVMTCGKDDLTKKSSPGLNGSYRTDVSARNFRFSVTSDSLSCLLNCLFPFPCTQWPSNYLKGQCRGIQ